MEFEELFKKTRAIADEFRKEYKDDGSVIAAMSTRILHLEENVAFYKKMYYIQMGWEAPDE